MLKRTEGDRISHLICAVIVVVVYTVMLCSLCCFNPLSAAESVREAVGRRVKLTLRRKVQLEVKGDKVENRVLVSDSCSVCANLDSLV